MKDSTERGILFVSYVDKPTDMKNLYISTILILFAVTISGCCKHYICNYPSSLLVAFHNYEPGELDSVYLTRYYPNRDEPYGPEYGDTTSPYHGIIAGYQMEDEEARYYFLTTYDDWQLRIPATNETYKIHSYSFAMVDCNSTFTCPNEQKVLAGFQVNDKKYEGTVLNIYK